jgi:hypothetical protein
MGLLRYVAVVAAAGLAVGACSSSSKSSSSSSSSSQTTAASGGSSTSSGQFETITSAIKLGESATFKATYNVNASGTTTTVTLEQKPPKTLFSIAGQGEVISDGTTSHFCTTGAAASCLTESGSSNPLASLTQLFSPQTALTALEQAKTRLSARAAGYNVTFSSQTFAGQDSTCVTASAPGGSAKYCVTKGGVLAYEGAGGATFQLTNLSTVVADSDFNLPAGASAITMPPGVSVP